MGQVTNWRVSAGSLDYPLVIAHRGDHAAAPENTIAAFKQAVEVGADGVELDVQLTSDGEVVVMHDQTLERTTTGKGMVRAHTFSKLRTLAMRHRSGHRNGQERIPTLDEVFDQLPSDFLVCVELKARFAGMKALPNRVGEVVRRHRRWETTMVHSFNPVSLFYLRRQEPHIAIGLIWSRRHPYPLRARWLSPLANPHWLDPADGTFTPKVLAHFHAQGKPVLAWDVDAGSDMERLSQMRLDAVVTDQPAHLARQKPRSRR